MRNLVRVIDSMIEHIPKNHNLINKLNSVKSSVPYSPPENMGNLWYSVAEILSLTFNKVSPESLTGWQRTVVDIFMDKVR